MFGTHRQRHYLDAAIVRIIGDVKAELSAHGEHHRVFAQHLTPYPIAPAPAGDVAMWSTLFAFTFLIAVALSLAAIRLSL
ncbi:MAG: hypothetical protein ABWY82_08670 [Tardiphaga sp.]|jgi:hypothetical protein